MYLAKVVLVLEHPFAWYAVRMTCSFLVVLIAGMFSCETTVAVLVRPVIVRIAVPVIAMSCTGVDMLVVAVLTKVAIAWPAVRHLDCFDGESGGQRAKKEWRRCCRRRMSWDLSW